MSKYLRDAGQKHKRLGQGIKARRRTLSKSVLISPLNAEFNQLGGKLQERYSGCQRFRILSPDSPNRVRLFVFSVGRTKWCQPARLQLGWGGGVGVGDVHFLPGKPAHAFSVKGLYASLLSQPRGSLSSEKLPEEEGQRTLEPPSRCSTEQGLLSWPENTHCPALLCCTHVVEEGCWIRLRENFSGPRRVNAST